MQFDFLRGKASKEYIYVAQDRAQQRPLRDAAVDQILYSALVRADYEVRCARVGV